MSDEITISEVAARTGLASSALRFYERRGLLRPAGRSGGKRIYDPSVLEQVALIDLLRKAGFSLGEIAGMVDHRGNVDPRWREVARTKLAELEDQIALARQAKKIVEHTLSCPHETLDQCPVFRRGVKRHAATLAARATTMQGAER